MQNQGRSGTNVCWIQSSPQLILLLNLKRLGCLLPMGNILTTTETTRLSELEGVIERNLKAFYEVGKALIEIRGTR